MVLKKEKLCKNRYIKINYKGGIKNGTTKKKMVKSKNRIKKINMEIRKT